MKKVVLLLAFLACVFGKIQAQNIHSDVSFLKANMFLFSACITFDDVYKAEDQKVESEKLLPILKQTLDAAAKYFKLLKVKYSTNKDFTSFEQYFQVLQKCCTMLKSDDPTWALAYTLVKMKLKDFVNTTLK